MAIHCKVDVIFSPIPKEAGFGVTESPRDSNIRWFEYPTWELFKNRNFGKYQFGVVRHMVKSRPDAVLIYSNANYLNYWIVLFLGRILGIPVYSRGHGLVKKMNPNFFHKLAYFLMVNFSKKYICYASVVKESLDKLTLKKEKLSIDYNFQYNDFQIPPTHKTGKEKGILFIGRVRQGCGVLELISIVEKLRLKIPDCQLHIIGGGELEGEVKKRGEKNEWITYYGTIFDDEKIGEITRKCRFGCVVGSAGLSVVHMMSFSVPVIVHNDIRRHQGPEPSYVEHGKNGWFYGSFLDLKALQDTLEMVFGLPSEEMHRVQENAYQTYVKLSTPPFHERLLKIMELLP
jgi:glycosyltransferase involved in cell wall biosynthesis